MFVFCVCLALGPTFFSGKKILYYFIYSLVLKYIINNIMNLIIFLIIMSLIQK